jgi:hypothetical protein
MIIDQDKTLVESTLVVTYLVPLGLAFIMSLWTTFRRDFLQVISGSGPNRWLETEPITSLLFVRDKEIDKGDLILQQPAGSLGSRLASLRSPVRAFVGISRTTACMHLVNDH